MKLNKKIAKMLVNENTSLIVALKKLNRRGKNLFLVDKKKRLLNTVSDGDIRRALIQGYKLNDKIKKLNLENPLLLKLTQIFLKLKKI